MHENEHCRAGVSKTKSKIRTSAEANEGLQLKSDFVIPKGMTVLGVVIPNGKPANKGFRREDRPDPYSERVEERRCLSDALRDEASETLLRQASAGGDFGPREASAATISRTTALAQRPLNAEHGYGAYGNGGCDADPHPLQQQVENVRYLVESHERRF